MPQQIQELVSGILIFLKDAEHRACDGNRILLLDAAHDHAKMLRFNYHSHTTRVNFVINGFSDLSREALLDLESSGKHIHQTWNFAETNDTTVWNVSDMAFPEKRKQVMLAK